MGGRLHGRERKVRLSVRGVCLVSGTAGLLTITDQRQTGQDMIAEKVK